MNENIYFNLTHIEIICIESSVKYFFDSQMMFSNIKPVLFRPKLKTQFYKWDLYEINAQLFSAIDHKSL
jgi:hypothetical protein